MNVTLISCASEVFQFGFRQLAACLKQAGHRAQLVFLLPEDAVRSKKLAFDDRYPPQLLDSLAQLCAAEQLIGFSLMTNNFLASIKVTQGLRARGISAPAIWGGIQPTVEPEECLRYADIVCLGEGEGALVELAERISNAAPYDDVQNLWLNTPSGIRRNPLRPLIQDLDSLPIIEYTFKDEYCSSPHGIVPLGAAALRRKGSPYLPTGSREFLYPLISSRGCPYACTFCCNDVYEQLYPHQKRLRWRSAASVIGEIKAAQSIAPVTRIVFMDDNFTARSIVELERFCEDYRREVGLPFKLQVSPNTIDQRRFEMMLKAGCNQIILGVETPNAEVAKMYNRQQLHKNTLAAVQFLEKNRHRMAFPPIYQFIVENPYESLDQTLETLRFGLELKRHSRPKFFSLVLYPGTGLYQKAVQDGLVHDKIRQIYAREISEYYSPYLHLWMLLFYKRFPNWLLRLLLTRWLVRLMMGGVANRVLNWMRSVKALIAHKRGSVRR